MGRLRHSFRQHWRGILTAITFMALGAFVYTLRHQIFETIRNLEDASLWILLFIVPFQAMHYHFVALLYRELFKLLDDSVNYRFLYKTALELNFVNLVFPSGGFSGFSYFGVRMRTQGVKASKSTLVQTMRFVLLFISFQILLFVGLVLLSFSGQANNFMILIASSLATLLLIGTLALTFIIGSERRIDIFFTFVTRFINRVIQVVRPNNPETINVSHAKAVFQEYHGNYNILRKKYKQMFKPLLYGLMINVTEIATVYTVFMAFGQMVNPGAVIIGYAVANFAGLISVLPGGIGVYEALMTGVLAAGGVPARLSLPVIVAYRVISIGLQIPVGAYFYHRAINSEKQS